MWIIRLTSENGPHLGIRTGQGLFDLTAADPEVFGSMTTWLAQPDPVGAVCDALSKAAPLPGEPNPLCPLDTQELWGAGVTYERSKVARMEESASGGNFYDMVYDAERPELFLKANPYRVVGPGEKVRIRRDSTWDVPEPELTLVISSAGNIVGYTIGNDMSSRSIEGENPLYLPQAKTWDCCAAVGPTIRLIDSSVNLRDLDIHLTIQRAGETVFDDSISTARMKQTPEDLVGFLFREATFPQGVFLMTGTGIVPPDSFTLKSGDVVSITIGEAGTLVNTVA